MALNVTNPCPLGVSQSITRPITIIMDLFVDPRVVVLQMHVLNE